jgi:hypothetical protein
MRGRHAIGPEIADRVSNAPFEATRLRAILLAMLATFLSDFPGKQGKSLEGGQNQITI